MLTDDGIDAINLACYRSEPEWDFTRDFHLCFARAIEAATLASSSAAREDAERALRKLYAVVIEQNRRGAQWHPDLFADMMSALADAKFVIGQK